MKHRFRWFLAPSLALVAGAALAEFHTFQIEEIYSDAGGIVQYVVLHESQGMNGENFLAGHTLTSTHLGATNSFTFPANLPGGSCSYYSCTASPTANRRVLIATQGFVALGLVMPDYVIPNAFIATDGGTINYAGVDQLTYAALPTDGVSALNRNGSMVPNVATNFAGQSASVAAVPPPVTIVNYEGLWWNAPAGSESGWGINFAHQGNVIFGTWFTYDTAGKGWWLTLITTRKLPASNSLNSFQ